MAAYPVFVYVVSRAGRQVDFFLLFSSIDRETDEKQRTQIQDMLPQQYYNEKVRIFNT